MDKRNNSLHKLEAIPHDFDDFKNKFKQYVEEKENTKWITISESELEYYNFNEDTKTLEIKRHNESALISYQITGFASAFFINLCLSDSLPLPVLISRK